MNPRIARALAGRVARHSLPTEDPKDLAWRLMLAIGKSDTMRLENEILGLLVAGGLDPDARDECANALLCSWQNAMGGFGVPEICSHYADLLGETVGARWRKEADAIGEMMDDEGREEILERCANASGPLTRSELMLPVLQQHFLPFCNALGVITWDVGGLRKIKEWMQDAGLGPAWRSQYGVLSKCSEDVFARALTRTSFTSGIYPDRVALFQGPTGGYLIAHVVPGYIPVLREKAQPGGVLRGVKKQAVKQLLSHAQREAALIPPA